MMIFKRSLMHELAINMLVALTVLLGISMTTFVIKYLGQAASGVFASEAIAAFLGFKVINYLPVLLSLSLFIAIVTTLTRSYRDSEMVIWFSSGLSLAAWVRPVLQFALPILLGILLLSVALSPWALQQSAKYRNQMDNRDDLSTLSPGVFKESRHADRVFFVESFTKTGSQVNNVFVQSVQQQKLGVTVAQRGHQETTPEGDRYLVLENGSRYEGFEGSPDYKILQFTRYKILLKPNPVKEVEQTSQSLPVHALVKEKSPANRAELHWRLSVPVSAVILMLIAIPLSFAAPRGGSSFNIMVALLLFMIYTNFLSIAQAWIAQQKPYAAMLLWGTHLMMLGLALYLYYRRIRLVARAYKKQRA